jgi:hypothetical protein
MEVDGNRRDDMADSPTNSQQTGSHLHPSIFTHMFRCFCLVSEKMGREEYFATCNDCYIFEFSEKLAGTSEWLSE